MRVGRCVARAGLNTDAETLASASAPALIQNRQAQTATGSYSPQNAGFPLLRGTVHAAQPRPWNAHTEQNRTDFTCNAAWVGFKNSTPGAPDAIYKAMCTTRTNIMEMEPTKDADARCKEMTIPRHNPPPKALSVPSSAGRSLPPIVTFFTHSAKLERLGADFLWRLLTTTASCTHPLTIGPFTNSLSHSLTYSFTHPLICSPIHSICSLTHSPTHPRTHPLTHSLPPSIYLGKPRRLWGLQEEAAAVTTHDTPAAMEYATMRED